MKKFLLLFFAVIFLGSILSGCKKKTAETTEPAVTKKKVTKPLNEIPAIERPYVVLSPTLGREIEVTIHRVPKTAEKLEFLAEYQFGTSLGGNENAFDLTKGLPASKQFALYSRSAGGKTSYEEDVKSGTLQLMFAGTNEYWLKQDWRYFDRTNAKSSTKTAKIESKDGNFTIDGTGLKTVKYAIVYNSPGYPTQLPGSAKSDLYTVQFAGSTTGEFTASIKTDSATGSIYSWDGQKLSKMNTDIKNGVAAATDELAEAYMIIE